MNGIIETSTSQRKQETKTLFQKVKPLLDNGLSYNKAVRKIKKLPATYSCSNLAWFRDLVEYGETQGYKYDDYRFPSNQINNG